MTEVQKNPVAIIQARTGSERLPGKSLLKIHGKSLIERVIESARKLKNINEVILATTWLSEDDPLAEAVKMLGCKVYRGDPDDLLTRYYKAALEYKADPIMRLCGDSPIIAVDYMDNMVKEHIALGADLTCNISPLPLGPTGAVISFSALETMYNNATTDYQREHVTPYISENRSSFSINEMTAPAEFHRNYRLTIDEKDDLLMFQKLYETLEDGGHEINLLSAIKVLDENENIANINRTVLQRSWRT